MFESGNERVEKAIERERLLSEVIRNCFPSAKSTIIARYANNFCNIVSTNRSLDLLLYSREKDIESLKRIYLRLRQAEDQLNNLGFYGSGKLEPLAKDLFEFRRPDVSLELIGNLESRNTVMEHIRYLKIMIYHATRNLRRDRTQPTFPDVSKPSRGRQPNAFEVIFGLEAYDAYLELSGGIKPTRSVHSHAENHPAGGPFLDFVGRLLDFFEIRCNVEHVARQAIERKRSME